MAIQQYGIAGVPNTTITMITQKHEDHNLSVNNDGDKIPDDKRDQRIHAFNRVRLGRHITGKEDVSPELPVIFPVS